jgi:hypothetical protein
VCPAANGGLVRLFIMNSISPSFSYFSRTSSLTDPPVIDIVNHNKKLKYIKLVQLGSVTQKSYKMCDSGDVQALVVDNGSGMCKAGFAGTTLCTHTHPLRLSIYIHYTVNLTFVFIVCMYRR